MHRSCSAGPSPARGCMTLIQCSSDRNCASQTRISIAALVDSFAQDCAFDCISPHFLRSKHFCLAQTSAGPRASSAGTHTHENERRGSLMCHGTFPSQIITLLIVVEMFSSFVCFVSFSVWSLSQCEFLKRVLSPSWQSSHTHAVPNSRSHR